MSGDTVIHVLQSSQEFTLSRAERSVDLRVTLQRGAPLIGFTEISNDGIKGQMARACREDNYRLYHDGGTCGVAVGPECRVLAHGYTRVNAAVPRPPSQGGHGERGIQWVKVEYEGVIITFVEGHWVTGQAAGGARRAAHKAMTEAVINRTERSARGRKIGFFAGDVNVDEAQDKGANHNLPDWMFDHAGMTTIYDELHRLPSTHGTSTIDIIGSVDSDRRVHALRAVVHPKQNKDHRDVSGFYLVS